MNDVETRLQRTERILEISRELTSTTSLERLLHEIVEAAAELTDTESAGILLLGEGAGELRFVAASSFADQLVDVPVPIESSIAGAAFSSGEPVIVPDVRVDPRYYPVVERLIGFVARSLLAVPLQFEARRIGVLEVENKRDGAEFSRGDVETLTVLAAQATVALENARLVEALRKHRDHLEELVAERTAELQTANEQLQREVTERKRAEEALRKAAATAERSRLARDLHDAVTQTLFSASLIAEALPRVWERHPEEGRRGLEELRQLTRGALAEMRTLLLELRPAALTEKPLGELLRLMTQAVTSRTRVPVTLTVERDCPLPPDVQVALYRITQEAFNNVAKHAGASHVSVTLCCQPERVTLCIRDDGRGFDPSDVLPDRLGVGIMRERAESVGATLEIESRPGQGTQVVVMWTKDEGRRTEDK